MSLLELPSTRQEAWRWSDLSALPALAGRHHVTDAHFVTLAARHGLKLATLDEPLCRAPWAASVAVHPLGQ